MCEPSGWATGAKPLPRALVALTVGLRRGLRACASSIIFGQEKSGVGSTMKPLNLCAQIGTIIKWEARCLAARGATERLYGFEPRKLGVQRDLIACANYTKRYFLVPQILTKTTEQQRPTIVVG